MIISCSRSDDGINDNLDNTAISSIGSNSYDCGESFQDTFEFTLNSFTYSAENFGIFHNEIVEYSETADTSNYDLDTSDGWINFTLDHYEDYVNNVSTTLEINDYNPADTSYFDELGDFIEVGYNIADTSSNEAIEMRDYVLPFLDSILNDFPELMNETTRDIMEDILYDVADDGELDDFDYLSIIDSLYTGDNETAILASFYSIVQYSTCLDYSEGLESRAAGPGVGMMDAGGAIFGLWKATAKVVYNYYANNVEPPLDSELGDWAVGAMADGASTASLFRWGRKFWK